MATPGAVNPRSVSEKAAEMSRDSASHPFPGTAANPVTFSLVGKTVHRLGFGTAQLTGYGHWGPPPDRQTAIRVLRRSLELGIDLIDTAASYGPYISETLIREALHPYPESLLIATKAGTVRTGPWIYIPLGRAEFIRQDCELSLRRLGVERIDLFQLHKLDPKVTFEEQVGVLGDLQTEGKIRAIGLSNVTLDELLAARQIVEVATVQNEYNISTRNSEDVVDYCEQQGLGFFPWSPLRNGKLPQQAGIVSSVANETGATKAQVALAWLLARSPVMLPIPGTASIEHLEENCAAAALTLSAKQVAALSAEAQAELPD